jgi:hypothetical protein
MRRVLMPVVVGMVIAVTAGWLAACGPLPGTKAATKPVTAKDVEAMMKKVHEGKDAPLARTGAELKKETPHWEALAKDAKAFADMGEMLHRLPKYTDDSKYLVGAAGLVKAVKEKDKPAAAEAFAGLSKSCSACHYYPAKRTPRP